MDPAPATIPVHRPAQAAAGDGDDRVIADVLTRWRDVQAGIAPPAKLGPAILAARREQYIDNAAALDAALLEIIVAAMSTMEVLRLSCPEIAHRHEERRAR